MIEKKIQDIAETVKASMEHMRQAAESQIKGMIVEATKQMMAIEELGVNFPSSLDVLLDRCNGGKSFLVRDFELGSDLQSVDITIRGRDGCGHQHQFWTNDGIMLPKPAGALKHKVRVVVLAMTVLE